MLPLHAASLADRGGAAPGRRVAVRARRRRRDRARSRRRTATRARRFAWASVTKLATAVAMLVAAEEGIVDLDEPAGPPGSTFRHLLAHASGLPFEAGAPIAQPGKRRIYSNYGFEVAAALVEERAGDAVRRRTSRTCGHGTTLRAAGLGRLRRVAGRSPTCARSRASCSARRGSPARRSPRRRRCSSRASPACCPASAGRSRTTGGSASSCATASRRTGRARATRRATFGHFGRSGTFLWVDPDAGVALGVPHRPGRSATGRSTRGRAWPTRCWPKRPCPGVRPGTRLEPPPIRGLDRRSAARTAYESRNSSRSAFSSSGWSMPDEVARAGDDDELRVLGIPSARCCGDRVEVGLVVVADDHERRHRQRRERRQLGPDAAPAPRARTAARARAAAADAPRRGARA